MNAFTKDIVRTIRHTKKRFISIEEVSAACPKVSKTHIEQLKAAGALDGMPDTSQITLFDGF